MPTHAVLTVPFTEIDSASAVEFQEWLRRYRDTNTLVLDMRHVEFFDSTAIRVLIVEHQARPRTESLRLRHLSRPVEQVLDICGLSHEFVRD